MPPSHVPDGSARSTLLALTAALALGIGCVGAVGRDGPVGTPGTAGSTSPGSAGGTGQAGVGVTGAAGSTTTGAAGSGVMGPLDIGFGPAARLNQRQYNNTVRDLLGTTLTPGDGFPADEQTLGFDTIAGVLRV